MSEIKRPDRCPGCNIVMEREVDGVETSNWVGIEYAGGYDGVVEWRCSLCEHAQARFSEDDFREQRRKRSLEARGKYIIED